MDLKAQLARSRKAGSSEGTRGPTPGRESCPALPMDTMVRTTHSTLAQKPVRGTRGESRWLTGRPKNSMVNPQAALIGPCIRHRRGSARWSRSIINGLSPLGFDDAAHAERAGFGERQYDLDTLDLTEFAEHGAGDVAHSGPASPLQAVSRSPFWEDLLSADAPALHKRKFCNGNQ